MYAIDLFCGAGGMSEGITQAGFHILFSSDINQDVERTYVNRHEQLGYIQNYNTFFQRSDVRELSGQYILNTIRNLGMFNEGRLNPPTDIDVIFGGPPCQGFSRAGRRDPNDPRNMLFREYLRIISEVTPRYVVMENVEGFNDTRFYNFTGITGHLYADGALAPDILRNEFRLIGYNTLEPQVLDASDFGVPQRRRRAIFIGYRDGELEPNYPVPTQTEENKITVLSAIGDLIRNEDIRHTLNPQLTDYQIQSRTGRTRALNNQQLGYIEIPNNLEISNHTDIIKERFSLYNDGEDSNGLRNRIIAEGINLTDKIHLTNYISETLNLNRDTIIDIFRRGNVDSTILNILLTKKTIRKRLYAERCSLTVVTLPDDFISPFENRTFSVREMARLQSFDDSFNFLGPRTTGGSRRRTEVPQYTQVGNAVPPLLARAVALEIARVLQR